jgi:hypothetical protein
MLQFVSLVGRCSLKTTTRIGRVPDDPSRNRQGELGDFAVQEITRFGEHLSHHVVCFHQFGQGPAEGVQPLNVGVPSPQR